MSYRYVCTSKLGQLDVLSLSHPKFQAKISLFGAQVLSFKPTGQDDLLWLSQDAVLDGSKAIRGGCPICWPWFGPDAVSEGADGTKTKGPQHGYARLAHWQLLEVKETESEVDLLLVPVLSDEIKSSLPLKLECHLSFSDTLSISLITKNLGDRPVPLSQAIHTYFAIEDINNCQLLGLEDCRFLDQLSGKMQTQNGSLTVEEHIDRIYFSNATCLKLDTPSRSIQIVNRDHDSIVVWNPWQSLAKEMADFDDMGFKRMLCVETANTQGLVLEPDQLHTLTQALSSQS